MGLIFYSSSLPGKDIPQLFKFQDVFFHLLVYAILAYLVARAQRGTFIYWGHKKIFLFSCIFGILYAISDELHQYFVPGRISSFFDLGIDSLGAVLGSFGFNLKEFIYGKNQTI